MAKKGIKNVSFARRRDYGAPPRPRGPEWARNGPGVMVKGRFAMGHGDGKGRGGGRGDCGDTTGTIRPIVPFVLGDVRSVMWVLRG
jgi:hypothetical protein